MIRFLRIIAGNRIKEDHGGENGNCIGSHSVPPGIGGSERNANERVREEKIGVVICGSIGECNKESG